jgi:hypothetical protein
MPNYYHENKGKQMAQKIHGMAPSQQENEPYVETESMRTENILKEDAAQHSSIQFLAYQIYCEKGGTALDNWLEAERILSHKHHK